MEIKKWNTTHFQKFQSWLKGQFVFSIQEIALAGLFTALWIISAKFLTIDFGVMKAGIVYIWAILIGLTIKPFAAVMIAIIADTISIAISDYGIGSWMWEYAIIYPLIVLFASGFKHAFKIKNKYLWWGTMMSINMIALIVAFAIAIHKSDFIYHTKNLEAIDFSQSATKIAIWTCMGIMFVLMMGLSYLAFRFEHYKNYLAIFTLVSATVILFIWIWGPIAQVRFLIKLDGSQQAPKGSSHYWKLYDVYLVARVLKTPIIVPIYTAIIGAVYFANQEVSKYISKHNRW